MPTGVANATWSVSYARFGCRSELFFGHPDPGVNVVRWQVLNDRKDEIVAAFGDELIFDELPNGKGCRIEARLSGPKIGDRQRWREVINWMLDTQSRLRHAISEAGGVPTVTAYTAGAAGGQSIGSWQAPSSAPDTKDAAST